MRLTLVHRRPLLFWLVAGGLLTGGLVLYLSILLTAGLVVCKTRVDGMAWSTDGSQLAFASVSGYIGVVDQGVTGRMGGFCSVRTLEADRSSQIFTRITPSLAEMPPSVLHRMQWSPNGRGLMIDEMFFVPLYDVALERRWGFVSYGASEGGLARTWSPDNRLLILAWEKDYAKILSSPGPSDGSQSPYLGSRTLLKMPADRAHVTTNPGGKDLSPRMKKWSPDTGRIFFISDSKESGNGQLWCYDVATQRDLGTLFEYDYTSADRPRDYVWSPDGKSIALLFLPVPSAAAGTPGARIELWDVEKCVRYQTLAYASPSNESPVLAPPPVPSPIVKTSPPFPVDNNIPHDSVHEIAWSRDGKRLAGAFLLQSVQATPQLNSRSPAVPKAKACALCWWSVEDARVLASGRYSSPGIIDLVRLSPDLDKAALSHYVTPEFFGDLSVIKIVQAPAEAIRITTAASVP